MVHPPHRRHIHFELTTIFLSVTFELSLDRGSGALPMSVLLEGDNAIEKITAGRGPHYEPMGWHHWPEHPWLSYQFRRGLGETQEGGGSVSEVLMAASRMIPGDLESWHAEWKRIAD